MTTTEQLSRAEKTQDAWLQEVRDVLADLKEQFNGCWCRADVHTDACQRARALMEELEVRP